MSSEAEDAILVAQHILEEEHPEFGVRLDIDNAREIFDRLYSLWRIDQSAQHLSDSLVVSQIDPRLPVGNVDSMLGMLLDRFEGAKSRKITEGRAPTRTILELVLTGEEVDYINGMLYPQDSKGRQMTDLARRFTEDRRNIEQGRYGIRDAYGMHGRAYEEEKIRKSVQLDETQRLQAFVALNTSFIDATGDVRPAYMVYMEAISSE